MRKITSKIVAAFEAGNVAKVGNTRTDGESLFLHGHKIATKEGGGLRISTCGWSTRTTLDRLNALPGVRIYSKKGELYLNGEKWDGSEVTISQWDIHHKALKEGLV